MHHSPHDARGQRGSFSGAAASSSPSTRLAGMTRIPSSTHLPIKTELHPLSSLVNPSPARADQPGLTCPRPTHLALLSLLGLFTSYTLGYSHVAERRLIRHSLPHCSPRPSRRLRVVPLWRGREWMEGLVASVSSSSRPHVPHILLIPPLRPLTLAVDHLRPLHTHHVNIELARQATSAGLGHCCQASRSAIGKQQSGSGAHPECHAAPTYCERSRPR